MFGYGSSPGGFMSSVNNYMGSGGYGDASGGGGDTMGSSATQGPTYARPDVTNYGFFADPGNTAAMQQQQGQNALWSQMIAMLQGLTTQMGSSSASGSSQPVTYNITTQLGGAGGQQPQQGQQQQPAQQQAAQTPLPYGIQSPTPWNNGMFLVPGTPAYEQAMRGGGTSVQGGSSGGGGGGGTSGGSSSGPYTPFGTGAGGGSTSSTGWGAKDTSMNWGSGSGSDW